MLLLPTRCIDVQRHRSTTFSDEHPVYGSMYLLLSLSDRFRYNIPNRIHNNNNNNGYEYKHNDNIMAPNRDICVTIVSKLKRRQRKRRRKKNMPLMRARNFGCFSVNNFVISYFENPFKNKIMTNNCGRPVLNALFVYAV